MKGTDKVRDNGKERGRGRGKGRDRGRCNRSAPRNGPVGHPIAAVALPLPFSLFSSSKIISVKSIHSRTYCDQVTIDSERFGRLTSLAAWRVNALIFCSSSSSATRRTNEQRHNHILLLLPTTIIAINPSTIHRSATVYYIGNTRRASEKIDNDGASAQCRLDHLVVVFSFGDWDCSTTTDCDGLILGPVGFGIETNVIQSNYYCRTGTPICARIDVTTFTAATKHHCNGVKPKPATKVSTEANGLSQGQHYCCESRRD